MFLADVFNKELAISEPYKSWKLPWKRTGAVISQWFFDSLIDNINNRCKMCISVRRNHTSHICFILVRRPIFHGCMEMLQKASFLFFYFLIFRCGDIWTILQYNKCALPLLNVYLVLFLQLMSIIKYSKKMWLFLSNCQAVYSCSFNFLYALVTSNVTFSLECFYCTLYRKSLQKIQFSEYEGEIKIIFSSFNFFFFFRRQMRRSKYFWATSTFPKISFKLVTKKIVLSL